VEFFYEEVKDTTFIFRIRFWIGDPNQPVFLKARSEAIKAINETFKAKVVIMPSAVITLDFGITGGSSLREQLEDLSIPLYLQESKPGKNKSEKEAEPKAEAEKIERASREGRTRNPKRYG
jgi:hypothetical protein